MTSPKRLPATFAFPKTTIHNPTLCLTSLLPLPYNVDPTGANDSTDGIQAAFNDLKKLGVPRRLVFPLGYYKLSARTAVADGSPHKVAVTFDAGDFEIVSQDPNNRPVFFISNPNPDQNPNPNTTCFLARVYNFLRNNVSGGFCRVKFGGPVYAAGLTLAPQIAGLVVGPVSQR